MLIKLYPRIVTLFGGIGLGLALTYFAGVILTFLPEMEDWARFFGTYAIPFLLPPYLLLVFHLILRNHVGRFLLNKEAFEEARDYSSSRVRSSLIRGRREAANQRIVWARALIGLGEYEEARKALHAHLATMPGRYAEEGRRWLVEIALRQEERLEAQELFLTLEGAKPKDKGQVAALMAARAELALREEDLESFRESMLRALWLAPGSPRVALVRLLAGIYSEEETPVAQNEESENQERQEDPIKSLEKLTDRWGREIPARRSELFALRAWLYHQRGQGEEARKWLEEARQQPKDQWSELVMERVTAILES